MYTVLESGASPHVPTVPVMFASRLHGPSTQLPSPVADSKPQPGSRRPGRNPDDEWYAIQRFDRHFYKQRAFKYVASFLLVCAVYWWLCNPYQYAFRPSRPLTDAERVECAQSMRPRLKRHLLHFTSHTGAAAPALCDYREYALVRLSDNSMIDIMNPNYTATGYRVTTTELATICPRDDVPVVFERSKSITLTYDTPLDKGLTRSFYDNDAYRVQHWVDILKGRWPCGNNDTHIQIPKFNENYHSNEL